MEENGRGYPGTKLVILMCVGVFFFESLLSFAFGRPGLAYLFSQYGFSMEAVSAGRFWTFFTSVFLHASPEHLILNMIALFFFGRAVETELGTARFFLVFFGSAVFGDLLILLMTQLGLYPVDIPTVGASGAIFGLLGTAMFTRPLDLVFYPYLVPVPMVLVAILYILYNLAGFFYTVATGETTGISYISHLGGLGAGAVFGFAEARNRGRSLVIIFLFVILIPVLWNLVSALQGADYTRMISEVF